MYNNKNRKDLNNINKSYFYNNNIYTNYYKSNINYKNYYDNYKYYENPYDNYKFKKNKISNFYNRFDYYNNNFNDYNYDDFYTDSDSDEEEYEDEYLDDEEYFELKTLEDKNNYGYMYDLPSYKNRLIVLDTEVSGKTEKDYIIEICAYEMINGKLIYKNKFHSFFKPKNYMKKNLIKKHKIPSKAFYYTPFEEKQSLLKFLAFVKDSLIISHNATFDMKMINKSLNYYNLPTIDPYQFKCSMRIFLNYYNFFSPKFSKLKECCEFFNIKYKKRRLHLASYDAYLTGMVMEKIFKHKKFNENKSNFIFNNNNSVLEDNTLKIIEKKILEDKNYKKVIDIGNKDKNLKNFENKNIGNNIRDNKENEIEDFIDKNIESILSDFKKEEEEEKEKLINNNLEKINKEYENKEKEFEDFIDKNIESILSDFKKEEEEEKEKLINNNLEKINKEYENKEKEFEDFIDKNIESILDDFVKVEEKEKLIKSNFKSDHNNKNGEDWEKIVNENIEKIIEDIKDFEKKKNLEKETFDEIFKIISDDDKNDSKIFLGKKYIKRKK